MKIHSLLFILLVLQSCSHVESDIIEETVDIAIKTHNGTIIEIPELYDSLVINIPEIDSSKFVKIIKLKGFKQTHWGRGNYPPKGPRIVSWTFKKDNCECIISKTYNNTIEAGYYQISESIECSTKE